MVEKIKFTPLGGRLLVKKIEKEKTDSGIFIPDSANDKQTEPLRGTVICLPEPNEAPELKVGDEVLYGRFAGTTVTLKEGVFVIMHKSDLLGLL